MTFQANVLRVIIASPGDVAEERKAITEGSFGGTMRSLRPQTSCFPVKWETHSTPQQGGQPASDHKSAAMDDADIMVASSARGSERRAKAMSVGRLRKSRSTLPRAKRLKSTSPTYQYHPVHSIQNNMPSCRRFVRNVRSRVCMQHSAVFSS